MTSYVDVMDYHVGLFTTSLSPWLSAWHAAGTKYHAMAWTSIDAIKCARRASLSGPLRRRRRCCGGYARQFDRHNQVRASRLSLGSLVVVGVAVTCFAAETRAADDTLVG